LSAEIQSTATIAHGKTGGHQPVGLAVLFGWPTPGNDGWFESDLTVAFAASCFQRRNDVVDAELTPSAL